MLLPLLTVGLTLTAPADTIRPKADSVRQLSLQEVVVSASRVAESVLRSPVSIEVLDFQKIGQSAQPSFFDAIENLKGVQLLTPSMGFKVYNARGFANTTNVRFVQLVDGMDNQAPHIGAPIAGALAPSDLDIQRVEIMPGTASALYGLNALNGLANILTRSPFESAGFSASQRTGLNHIGEAGIRPQVASETALRYAQVFNPRLAFKVNLVYQTGYDWLARNLGDLNPNANTSLGLLGITNPGRDAINVYGDESPNRRALTLNGQRYVVSRTGYAEEQVTDYRLRNLRGDLALHYRFTPNLELAYLYRAATLDNVYQRTNRFRLDNYRLDQHGLTLTTPSIAVKAYRTSENTGDSYNLRSMAENIDRSFKSDNAWFADFSTQFRNSVAGGAPIPAALTAAQQFADRGRPQPGTPAFKDLVTKLRDINNWDVGAALRVRSWLYHVDGQVEPTRVLWRSLREKTGLNLLLGVNYRQYQVYPDGNYFINPVEADRYLTYRQFGSFVQATRTFWQDKLKLSATLRVDKNQYFAARLNPRVSVVFSPTETHHWRLSYQNGYRFPSLFEAFSNVNSGGVKRVGGLPVMSQGIFENSYFRTAVDAFQNAINTDVNVNRLTTEQAIQKNKGLLKKNTYTYLKPEQVNSLELGYKGLWLRKKLYIDADFYYNSYRNFMAQVEANIPKRNTPDSIAYYLADRSQQDRYRLWTNSKTTVYNYGTSIGLRYSVAGNWVVMGNASYARLDRTESGDGLEEAFNTPRWITNVGVSNASLGNGIGFSVNYKYQSAFLWQSSLATGMVPAIHNLDAQVNYRVTPLRLTVKLGGTNLLNRPYYTFVAGPTVGGFYYLSLAFE
ncbi:TonB-dependent receptor [Nibrella saemangeumensis]|uniref:TonB-dependent receptor n=1 Tax=Nibrella saemangeumensis TaxID=1084526 RepID=A0ABP8MJJ0_9BACT